MRFLSAHRLINAVFRAMRFSGQDEYGRNDLEMLRHKYRALIQNLAAMSSTEGDCEAGSQGISLPIRLMRLRGGNVGGVKARDLWEKVTEQDVNYFSLSC